MDQCECLHHATRDLGIVMLTGHHEACPKNPGVLAASKILIEKLVRGIEDWASQEDGIPDDLWDAYAHAKSVLGEPINPDIDTQDEPSQGWN